MTKADNDFPSFDGWTVERDDVHNGFDFVKFHDAGKGDPPKLVVAIRGDLASDPMMVYERGVRDCYAEDVRVSPPDDVAIWQERYDAADRTVVARKVRNGLAKGFDWKYALERLAGAGFTLAEMVEIVGED